MTGLLGLWIARFSDATRLTQWHYVESEIAGRQITHCGRQLAERPGTALAPLVAPPSVDATCKRCQR